MLAWLDANCRRDSSYPTNTVSSIYYDTPDWRHLREKINGDYIKSKLRLRWYSHRSNIINSGEEEPSWVFAELKRKIGSQRTKQRVKVEMECKWLEIADLNETPLLSLPGQLLTRGFLLPPYLLPAMLITYQRKRYVDLRTGTRINLDNNIHVRRFNPRMIQPGRILKVSSPVIEFKSSYWNPPHGFDALFQFGARRTSFSKYQICYRSLDNTIAI